MRYIKTFESFEYYDLYNKIKKSPEETIKFLRDENLKSINDQIILFKEHVKGVLNSQSSMESDSNIIIPSKLIPKFLSNKSRYWKLPLINELPENIKSELLELDEELNYLRVIVSESNEDKDEHKSIDDQYVLYEISNDDSFSKSDRSKVKKIWDLVSDYLHFYKDFENTSKYEIEESIENIKKILSTDKTNDVLRGFIETIISLKFENAIHLENFCKDYHNRVKSEKRKKNINNFDKEIQNNIYIISSLSHDFAIKYFTKREQYEKDKIALENKIRKAFDSIPDKSDIKNKVKTIVDITSSKNKTDEVGRMAIEKFRKDLFNKWDKISNDIKNYMISLYE